MEFRSGVVGRKTFGKSRCVRIENDQTPCLRQALGTLELSREGEATVESIQAPPHCCRQSSCIRGLVSHVLSCPGVVGWRGIVAGMGAQRKCKLFACTKHTQSVRFLSSNYGHHRGGGMKGALAARWFRTYCFREGRGCQQSWLEGLEIQVPVILQI